MFLLARASVIVPVSKEAHYPDAGIVCQAFIESCS